MSFNSGYKLLYHPDRVKTLLEGNIPKPITVEISPTSYCNHACTYCAFDSARNTAQLEPAVFKKLIRQLSKMDVKSINISGTGEPLIYPNLIDFIKYAKIEERMSVGLITNGSLLNKNGEELANLCSYIRISLDACTPETHKKIHGSDDFDRIIENIKLIVGKKAQIGVQFVFCEDNASEAIAMASFVKELGVDYLQYKPVVYYGKKEQLLKGAGFDYQNIIKQADDNFKVVVKIEEFNEVIKGREYKNCNAVKLVGSVVENGDISICCHLKHNPDYIVGNINILDFNILWGSIRHQQVIDFIDLNKCPPSCGRWGINIFLENAIKSTMGITNKDFI